MSLRLQNLLNPQAESESEVTIKLAGKNVTLTQKPHIEADIKAAASVLNRLLDRPQEPIATFTSRVIESDG